MAYPDHNVLYRWNGETRLANPFSHLHNWASVHQNAVTSRPASSQDMTDTFQATVTELIDTLTDSGDYQPHEIDAVAETLGITGAELETVRAGEADGTLTHNEAYRRTRIAAATVEAVIHSHGAVTTAAILGASEAELRQWHEHDYPEAILDTLTTLERIEANDQSGNLAKNAGWALAESQLRRRCGFAFEVAQRLNVNVFDHSVKGVNLEPLTEFEKEHAAA